MKIRTKLILANLFIILFLLGSLTYVLLQRSSKLVYDYVIENATLSLSQTSQNLDNKLESYEEIANTLFLNTNINLILDQRYADQLEAYEVYAQQFQPFISAVRQTKDIANVKVYTDNPTFTFANVTVIDQEIRDSDWYEQAMDNKKGGYWTAPYLSDPAHDVDPVISVRKRLNNVDAKSPSVVNLEIKLSKFKELIQQESKNKRILFTLADGTVVIDSSGEGEQLASLSSLPFGDRILGQTSGSFRAEVEGKPYQVLFQTLESRNIVRGMKVIAFMPVNELTPKINQLRSISYVLFGAAFVISVILIGTITIGMTRRLSELSVKMRRVHKDNFQSFVVVKGKDEVAQLGEMYNLMVMRLGQLISEVYQSEIDRKEQAFRTKEVELYALQTQINPHFLFNVLNMIRGKLLIVGERDTAKVVGLLAKSFRMMLKNGGQMTRLAEEIDFVDNYLQIQQYRFGHKFTYSIDMPQDKLDVSIPKLIIQPLVENAISHGIELNPEQSRIWVTGENDGEHLVLTVGDDGLGMAKERLAEIEQWLKDKNSLVSDHHIGLRNVHARLRYLYGEPYGIRVSSVEGEGTTITMMIPLRRAETDKNRGSSDV
ncbi:sensor histidine kinase [Paenibacillus rhizovicinus]|uniref:Sensor histidine kinase n=1 Tax=Paenibacillus rhizovicinus TaxID=2704463 RepID=A0A6C0P454_9BACL|nr:sensor histidine kinase [Paenibacillus rhizovicinus]QHW33314.1 sensor histidine kinase [Paenibacillus rhizovicinus]